MGICVQATDKNIVYTTKTLPHMLGTQHAYFYFTTEHLNKLDGDCLLILAQAGSVRKNQFVADLPNKKAAKELARLASFDRPADQVANGELKVCSKTVPGLQFSHVMLLNLLEPSKHDPPPRISEIVAGYKQHISLAVEKIRELKVNTLVVTELDWQNEIHKAGCFSVLSEIILNNIQLKSVVFACLSELSLSLEMDLLKQVRKKSVSKKTANQSL